MIGCLNCPITANYLITTLQNDKWKKKVANAPIIFEEIVMVMIKPVTMAQIENTHIELHRSNKNYQWLFNTNEVMALFFDPWGEMKHTVPRHEFDSSGWTLNWALFCSGFDYP